MPLFARVLAGLLTLIVPFASLSNETGERFTSYAGFVLGVGTLVDVRKGLGPTELQQTGDAGEYEEKLCYSLPTHEVQFLAGELSAFDHGLMGFGISAPGRDSRCQPWPTTMPRPAPSIGGLQLGMSAEDFSRVAGRALRWEGTRAFVFYESTKPYSQADVDAFPQEVKAELAAGRLQAHWDVVVSVSGTFAQGCLQELRVWKTQTN